VQPILRRDPKFWNVISINDPTEPAPTFTGARSVHRSSFYDVEDAAWAAGVGARAPQREDIAQIFRFVHARPGEAILIHCRAGVSRSTAISLGLILQGYIQAGITNCVMPAIEQLLVLRPQAVPNSLVLLYALDQFMNTDDAVTVMQQIYEHPRVLQNRASNPTRQ
jgi:predicted protein tyrosine phosphatase